MADQNQRTKAAADEPARPKFSDMTPGAKVKHVGKIILFICSLGFVFPGLFSD